MVSFLLPRLPEHLTADFRYSRLAENSYNLNPTHANMQPRAAETLKVYPAYTQLAEAEQRQTTSFSSENGPCMHLASKSDREDIQSEPGTMRPKLTQIAEPV